MARKRRQEQQIACITHGVESLCLSAPEKKTSTKYRTAIYARLSVYDLGRDKSDTMDNQIDMLKSYVSQQSDMTLVGLYVDNGWTGTNFIRPDFQRMLDDAKVGKINCIVVKDFSRLGRNYVETGHYLQNIFPLYHPASVIYNRSLADTLAEDMAHLAKLLKA